MLNESIAVETTIKILLDQQNSQQTQLSKLQSNIEQLMLYFGSANEENPKESFAKELIQYFNDELKLTERLTQVEKKQYENFIQFSDKISQWQEKQTDLEVLIIHNHKGSRQDKSSNESEALIKGQIETLMSKIQDLYSKQVNLEKNHLELQFQLGKFDTNISKYVTLNEINNLQNIIQREYISQIQLDDVIVGSNMKVEKSLGDKADRQTYLNLEKRVFELERQSNEYMKSYMEKLFHQFKEETISKLVTFEKVKSLHSNLQQEVLGQKQDYRQQFTVVQNQIQTQIEHIKQIQEQNKKVQENLKAFVQTLSEKAEKQEVSICEKKFYCLEQKQNYMLNDLDSLSSNMKNIRKFLFSESVNESINSNFDIQKATEKRISQENNIQAKLVTIENELENKVSNLQSQIFDMKFYINTLNEERSKTRQSAQLKLKTSVESIDSQEKSFISKPQLIENKQLGCFNNQVFSQTMFSNYKTPVEVDQTTGQITLDNLMDPTTRKMFESFNYYIQNNQITIESQLKDLIDTKQYLFNQIQMKLDDLVNVDLRINQKCDFKLGLNNSPFRWKGKLKTSRKSIQPNLSVSKNLLKYYIKFPYVFHNTRFNQGTTSESKYDLFLIILKCDDKLQLDILMDHAMMRELKQLNNIQNDPNKTSFFELTAFTPKSGQRHDRYIPSARAHYRNKQQDIEVSTGYKRELSNISIDQSIYNSMVKINEPDFFVSSNKSTKRKTIKSACLQRRFETKTEKIENQDFCSKSPLVAAVLKQNNPKLINKKLMKSKEINKSMKMD